MGPRFGRGPKDSLLTPDILSRGRCLPPLVLLLKPLPVGVASSGVVLVAVDDTDDTPRLRVLIVTLLLLATDLGEARGGVTVGAGSLERAE